MRSSVKFRPRRSCPFRSPISETASLMKVLVAFLSVLLLSLIVKSKVLLTFVTVDTLDKDGKK